jgi:hypothetical protein
MTTPADDITFAWCFSHGTMHRFHTTDTPWCTADWLWLAGSTETAALADKHQRYGDAQFLHDLTPEQQVAALELREIQ